VKEWAISFYNGDAWKNCRESFLQSKGYLCERCSSEGNPVVAKIAHHLIYLNCENISDPMVTYNWDNLEALCQDCHNREHHLGERKPRYKFDGDGNLFPLPG
jgi:5-methylcytosine-specific restriction endonuclease McrA